MNRISRVIAIAPYTSGFGYAVFEGFSFLVDWGLKQADGNPACLQKAGQLILRYQPDVLVVEDVEARGSRRRARVRRLIRSLHVLAAKRHVQVRSIPRISALRELIKDGNINKQRACTALSLLYPELEPLLPRWKYGRREDERVAIFDAVALGRAYFLRFHSRRLNLNHSHA